MRELGFASALARRLHPSHVRMKIRIEVAIGE